MLELLVVLRRSVFGIFKPAFDTRIQAVMVEHLLLSARDLVCFSLRILTDLLKNLLVLDDR